jgi:hypothetical protein
MLYVRPPDDLASVVLPVEVAGNEWRRIELPDMSVRGVVVRDVDGAPLNDAVVTLRLISILGAAIVEPITRAVEADGTFDFRGLPRGDYEIKARSPSGGSATRQLDVSDAPMVVQLRVSS